MYKTNDYINENVQLLDRFDGLIGGTKLHKLNFEYGNLYTKFEFQNVFGSIKDRSAFYIMKKAIEEGLINPDTTVIESSSGNFAVALAGICKELKIKFIPVIDPNISIEKENFLKLQGCEAIKVLERDETGGYLLNRIKTVKNYLLNNTNSYTPNQYENPNNYLAYYLTLGEEICQAFSKLDYAFISVSTGGTIAGLSNRLKEKYQNITIIGVDVEGSMIFSDQPEVRKITGIGASKRSTLFNHARIDDHVILSQMDIIEGCKELLSKHNLFVGASAGAAYMASKRVLKEVNKKDVNSIFISPDSGYCYLNNIYNQEWVNNNIIKNMHV